MELSNEIKEILKANEICDINILKNKTREDLKELNLNQKQLNQIIIYLQLNGYDIKKRKK